MNDMKTTLAILSLFGSAVVLAADVSSLRVEPIDGFGGELGSLESQLKLRVGEAFDPVTLSGDVRELKKRDEVDEVFADVDEAGDGVKVVFRVRRKLRYREPLTIDGNESLSESKLSDAAGFRDGWFYSESDLAVAAENVRQLYLKKGYPDARVTARTERLGEGLDGSIVMSVDEGAKQEIESFRFLGAENMTESELRDAIGDYPWWNPLGWFGMSPASSGALDECAVRIEEAYRDRGYLDVTVAKPLRLPREDDAEACDVQFVIDEGERYEIGEISITGLKTYPETAVRARSELPAAGTVAGAKALADAARRIQIAVGSGPQGLADTRVDIQRIPSETGTNRLDIVFKVTEGVPVVIDQIVVRGNDYTRDKVIRREINLDPGRAMVEDEAEKSKRKLESLGYFKSVRYYLEPSFRGRDENGAEYRDLVYEVEEMNTGNIMVGFGASSIDSIYAQIELSQANFDLFAPSKMFRGGGQKARASVGWGPRYQTIEASITEPHLFNRYLELDVEGHRRMRWHDDYDVIRSGASVGLSYPMWIWNPARLWNENAHSQVKFGRFGVRYLAEYVELDDVSNGSWTYNGRSVSLRDEESQYSGSWESVVRFFWTRDTRDSFRIPTTGSRTSLALDISAGGDVQFWRASFDHTSYFTTWKRFGHVFMVGLHAKTIDAISDDVPIFERLFLGGPHSIRGIRYRNVSPFATSDWYDDVAWGGQTAFYMNFEYIVPIWKMFRVAVFSDLGSVGEDSFDLDFSGTFAWTIGIGLRIDIPNFPVRLDFATPFKTPDNAEEETFTFSVGYDF